MSPFLSAFGGFAGMYALSMPCGEGVGCGKGKSLVLGSAGPPFPILICMLCVMGKSGNKRG